MLSAHHRHQLSLVAALVRTLDASGLAAPKEHRSWASLSDQLEKETEPAIVYRVLMKAFVPLNEELLVARGEHRASILRIYEPMEELRNQLEAFQARGAAAAIDVNRDVQVVGEPPMQTISLSRGTWTIDLSTQLGPEGGFGAVFAGRSAGGDPIAIKRLKVSGDEAEHRELRIAEVLAGRSLPHVMPVLDSGLDKKTGRYFIVMPRAEKSLQDYINANRRIPEADAIAILRGIAAGLASLGDLVHRDLKPGNVLLHEGLWKIADFGIARFVADSTSARTLKDCMTAPYAAPEQWLMDHASKATDVYALGCIAYALLVGGPPFDGPARPDYHRQHTQEDPPPLRASAMLSQIVANCLRKRPEARPQLDKLKSQLERAAAKLTVQESDPLAQAAAHIAAAEAAREAAENKNAAAHRRRVQLARDGKAALREILDGLYEEICESSTVAQRTADGVRMGYGGLTDEIVYDMIPASAFDGSRWKDVVVGAALSVTQQSERCPGRSANLWYADLDGTGSYGWWEVSYWSWGGRVIPNAPSALLGNDGLELAVLVVSGVTCGVQFAYRPRRIDGEDIDDFMARWKRWLAQASLGKLERPSRLPEEDC